MKVATLAAVGVPLRGITGCFLSNELIDSFPVHRVTAQGGALKEVYVTLEGGDLVEVVDHPSTPELGGTSELPGPRPSRRRPGRDKPGHGAVAPAGILGPGQGVLLTVDYGHTAAELYSQHRRRGTLTGFRKHAQTDSLYRSIGKQDMTAHVDFTSLEKLGRSCGLEVLGNTQREFLNNLGIDSFLGSLRASGLKQREVEATASV